MTLRISSLKAALGPESCLWEGLVTRTSHNNDAPIRRSSEDARVA